MRKGQGGSNYDGVVILVAVLAVLVPDRIVAQAANTYGDQRFIAVATPPTVPADWVILNQIGNQYLIQYVGAAKYGSRVRVLSLSPLPAGWAVESKTEDPYCSIIYLGGATYADYVTVWIDATPPPDWVVIDQYGNYRRL